MNYRAVLQEMVNAFGHERAKQMIDVLVDRTVEMIHEEAELARLARERAAKERN
jgi:hypothetical protein